MKYIEKFFKGTEKGSGFPMMSLRQLMTKQSIDKYFKDCLWKVIPHNQYNLFSIIGENDLDRIKFAKIFQQMKSSNNYDINKLQFDQNTSRAVASLLGLGISDALGSATQFTPFDKSRDIIKNGFSDIKQLIKKGSLDSRFGKATIWTDDCSMSLCMANSLLMNGQFDPKHMRYLFAFWLKHGLNNGGRNYSIGLGGNISISMSEFSHDQQDYTQQGNKFNNGNGSLMRLAPIPIYYSKNQQQTMKYSALSSRTTHNGDESAECSRLLGLIIVRLINRQNKQQWKQVIEKACEDFTTEVKTVKHLAMSEAEPQALYQEQIEKFKNFKNFNKSLDDRNWNWKDENFTYSLYRTKAQPGYIGSYCMDALSMALHTVWYGKSYFQIAMKNTNIGGDCDTVGAVAGQIAGAIYGIDEKMLKLYSEMDDFIENRYEIFLNAYKLHSKNPIID